MVFVPQELPVEAAERLRQEVLLLQHSALARVLSTVSRLGADPEKIRESGCTSPGEARKLMLALGFEHNPQLVIMDEPTNHLDLVSIECLEKALAEFAGALLLVSHDERFLETLTHLTWEIRESENGSYCFTL
jgi:ATPase subunit of ABC transporter with duplicated ATPase domains